MKKFLVSAGMFLLFFCGTVAAHPIEVTTSDGKVHHLESTDYDSMEDLMNDVWALENGSNNAN